MEEVSYPCLKTSETVGRMAVEVVESYVKNMRIEHLVRRYSALVEASVELLSPAKAATNRVVAG